MDPSPGEDARRTAAEKIRWRAELIARRQARPATERDAARTAVATHLAALRAPGSTVCGYLPLPSEPLDPGLLPRLHAAGVEVLVPVASPDMPLDWCRWAPGETRRGSFGIEEPTGPLLGSTAICRADVVLIPALAVDHAGHRLGRGGGHYDRSLALLSRGRSPATGGGSGRGHVAARLMAVVFDDEVVGALPHGPFDHGVTEVVTPAGGVRALG